MFFFLTNIRIKNVFLLSDWQEYKKIFLQERYCIKIKFVKGRNYNKTIYMYILKRNFV